MTYTRKRVEEITGIPARRIQFYTESGLVDLENPNPGRGRERQYSKRDIFHLLIIGELAKHRIELRRIKRIVVEYPRGEGKEFIEMFEPSTYEKPYSAKILIYDQKNIVFLTEKLLKEEDRPAGPPDYLLSDKEFRDKFVVSGESDYPEIEEYPSVLVLNLTYLANKLNEL